MFFSSPTVVLHEMLRVTRPDGSIVLVVWGRSEDNPFLNVITKVLARYVETPAANPDAPGAFRLSEHGKLTKVLTEAAQLEFRSRF